MYLFLFQRLKSVLLDLTAAIAFYTCIPVPIHWTLNFERVARWVPLVGLLIGGLLGLLDWTLALLHLPVLTRSVLVILLGVALTGGLHLDGAMDTADGLAVMDPHRRLQVMADSHTGAFGAMTAIALLLLKTAALTDLSSHRWLALVLAAGWGRWAQQVAIARYPYLKPTGKGAFHKTALRSFPETLPGLFLLWGISAVPVVVAAAAWRFSLSAALGGGAIALLVPAWFHRKLGGHTGDTYGAVVEWTEAFLLVLFTLIGATPPP